MTRDVDVARLGARGTELRRQMRLDDPRRTLGADERRVAHRHALPALEPRRHGVHRRAARHEIPAPAMQHLVDDVLHPRRPALHLRHDEDVLGARLVRLGAREALHAARPLRRGHALVHDARAAEVHLREPAVEPEDGREEQGVTPERRLEAVALVRRSSVVRGAHRLLVLPAEDGREIEGLQHQEDDERGEDAEDPPGHEQRSSVESRGA